MATNRLVRVLWRSSLVLGALAVLVAIIAGLWSKPTGPSRVQVLEFFTPGRTFAPKPRSELGCRFMGPYPAESYLDEGAVAYYTCGDSRAGLMGLRDAWAITVFVDRDMKIVKLWGKRAGLLDDEYIVRP